jgi:hypothetical protein
MLHHGQQASHFQHRRSVFEARAAGSLPPLHAKPSGLPAQANKLSKDLARALFEFILSQHRLLAKL